MAICHCGYFIISKGFVFLLLFSFSSWFNFYLKYLKKREPLFAFMTILYVSSKHETSLSAAQILLSYLQFFVFCERALTSRYGSHHRLVSSKIILPPVGNSFKSSWFRFSNTSCRSLTWVCIGDTWKPWKNADQDSADLGWGLRSCLSDKLDAGATGSGTRCTQRTVD